MRGQLSSSDWCFPGAFNRISTVVHGIGSSATCQHSCLMKRYDLKLWAGSLRESATYPPA